jgi:hypothetical protein
MEDQIGDNKETQFWSPEAEALCCLVAFVKTRMFWPTAAATDAKRRPGFQTNRRAARVLPRCYLGAREATICSKRGSPRSGSHQGSSFN